MRAEWDTTEVTERAAAWPFGVYKLYSHLYDSQDLTDGLRELNNGKEIIQVSGVVPGVGPSFYTCS